VRDSILYKGSKVLVLLKFIHVQLNKFE